MMSKKKTPLVNIPDLNKILLDDFQRNFLLRPRRSHAYFLNPHGKTVQQSSEENGVPIWVCRSFVSLKREQQSAFSILFRVKWHLFLLSLFIHPYQNELQEINYLPSQYAYGKEIVYSPMEDSSHVWIDEPSQVSALVEELLKEEVIAVDLEHHSLRSYLGNLRFRRIFFVRFYLPHPNRHPYPRLPRGHHRASRPSPTPESSLRKSINNKSLAWSKERYHMATARFGAVYDSY